jgi:hypothetical protein
MHPVPDAACYRAIQGELIIEEGAGLGLKTHLDLFESCRIPPEQTLTHSASAREELNRMRRPAMSLLLRARDQITERTTDHFSVNVAVESFRIV